MSDSTSTTAHLAATITKSASAQTYTTIRFLADRERLTGAYAAYAYFRWVDDTLDGAGGDSAGRSSFLLRQQQLLDDCFLGHPPGDLAAEEQILVDLVRRDPSLESGLHTYLYNMMAVMSFDAGRRGRIISQAELEAYTHNLASAVTEALHYFVGSNCYSPHDETRYQAVSAAHITHMLRDTFQDIEVGYYNIPREILEAGQITPQEVTSEPYRVWVAGRVGLARAYFAAGQQYIQQVESWRCRLAGISYSARFEGLLDTIQADSYRLRPQYEDGFTLKAGSRISRLFLASLFGKRRIS